MPLSSCMTEKKGIQISTNNVSCLSPIFPNPYLLQVTSNLISLLRIQLSSSIYVPFFNLSLITCTCITKIASQISNFSFKSIKMMLLCCAVFFSQAVTTGISSLNLC
ncbi:hypothetical protein S83_015907 [Arachis hypogaea]